MAKIESDHEDGILRLTIANEAKRNAFTHMMTADFARLLEAAEDDRAIKCVVITGAGDVAFSSGHDLKQMLAEPEHASDEKLNDAFVLPQRMTTPTIAAVNGYAFAAGLILALSCDLRICAENASFAAPGARIGLLPIGGQISRLPTLLPRAIAHELMITCREMHADEAYRLGFVNRLVGRGRAPEEAGKMAQTIVRNSAAVIREVKKGLEVLAHMGADAATSFEWATGRRLQSSSDAAEGMKAFLEKRSPNFV